VNIYSSYTILKQVQCDCYCPKTFLLTTHFAFVCYSCGTVYVITQMFTETSNGGTLLVLQTLNKE